MVRLSVVLLMLFFAAMPFHARAQEAAVEQFSRIIMAGGPDLPAAHFQRGLALLRLGMARDADADFTAALALDPRHALALNNRGVARVELGRLTDGLADYDAAITLSPKLAMAHANRALVLALMGQAKDALAAAKRALELDENLAVGWFSQGRALMLSERYVDATTAFDKTLELAPTHIPARLERAALRQRAGDLAGAIADHSAAIVAQPNRAWLYALRADAYALTGDYGRARVDLTRAVWLAPDDTALRQRYLTRRGMAPPPLETRRAKVDANVRAGPTTDARVLMTLPARTSVEVLERSPDTSWYLIGIRGHVLGYAAARLLE